MDIAHALAGASTTPFWLDSPERPDACEALHGAYGGRDGRGADLAVVGGGFTGLWTALLAVEADPDADVVLLEGAEVGWSASGRNGGFCSATLTHGYENGAHHVPDENDRLAELGLENLDEIEETVKRLGLDCEFERTGELSIAFEPYQVADLKTSDDPANGFHWLDAEQLAEHIRPAGALGGLLDTRNNALVNPAKLCWELKRVLLERGVRIFEHTPVKGISKSGDGVLLETGNGSVQAHRAALATNVFPTLLKKVSLHTVPVYDHALMTEPLSDEQMASIGWAHREGLDDVTNRFHYFRLTADNRILWGGWDAVYHFGGKVSWKYDQRPATFEKLAGHFYAMFPQLEGVRFTHKWGGPIDTCSRFFPFFTTAYSGRVAHTAGFTGMGVGASRFTAKVMLDLLSGKKTELTELEMVKKLPKPFPPEPAAWIGVQMMTKALVRADENEGRRGPFLKVMDALKMGFDS